MNTILTYAGKPQKLARELARLAVRSLYFEVKAYPKPGLVSFHCSGAHSDMDGNLFFRSLFSLRHYFYQVILNAIQDMDFNVIVTQAKQAEIRMLQVTHGVNTHRGAIFSLGIVAISAARLIHAQMIFKPELLQQQILSDWSLFLKNHLSEPDSHGHQVSQQFKVIGAKAMAEQAYPILFEILPIFLSLYEQTRSLDATCLYAYAKLLSHIDDTNILYRKQWDGMLYARKCANEILAQSTIDSRREYAIKLHQSFSSQKMSPGGVGDLIATLLFVGQLCHEGLRCHS